jgi:hypothetical protein
MSLISADRSKVTEVVCTTLLRLMLIEGHKPHGMAQWMNNIKRGLETLTVVNRAWLRIRSSSGLSWWFSKGILKLVSIRRGIAQEFGSDADHVTVGCGKVCQTQSTLTLITIIRYKFSNCVKIWEWMGITVHDIAWRGMIHCVHLKAEWARHAARVGEETHSEYWRGTSWRLFRLRKWKLHTELHLAESGWASRAMAVSGIVCVCAVVRSGPTACSLESQSIRARLRDERLKRLRFEPGIVCKRATE